MSEQQSSFSFKWLLYGAVALYFMYSIFLKGDSDQGQDYVEETLEEPTQGIRVELQEQEKDLFKIEDEEILAKREDSQIIAKYMNNEVDTFTIDEVQLMSADDPRSSVIRRVAVAGLFGYMMGKSMGSGVNRSAYATDKAYSKSSTSSRSQLRSSAKKTVSRKPTSSKRYGSGKSTKSYGG